MPKTRQKDAIRHQKARGEALREWLHERRIEAHKRLTRAKQEAPVLPRGVDRVPERYRVETPEPQVLVEHAGPNYGERRNFSRSSGRSLPPSKNTPHINPERDQKRGDR